MRKVFVNELLLTIRMQDPIPRSKNSLNSVIQRLEQQFVVGFTTALLGLCLPPPQDAPVQCCFA